MKIEIEREELQKRSIFLAVPMYGGQCSGAFTNSVLDLLALCMREGIKVVRWFMFNESLITRARNYCADAFLRSDCTHMLFIDSDIEFNADNVLQMLILQSDESEYDIIGGAYPKKVISWEKIKAAVDKGVADEDPNNLENFVGDFVVNAKNAGTFRIDQPVEVAELGTGFMMIRRKTFEKYQEAYPELMYKPDHARTEHFDGSREICAFFDCVIDPDTKRYLSEDYYFCYQAQKIGMKAWLCPWMSMKHHGAYPFGGSLAALGSIGASMTVDKSLLKKKKKR
jgi:hypothetical protein